MKQQRSIRPPGLAPSAPVPGPPTIQPEPEPSPERTRTWTLSDRNYWQRPVHNGESKRGIVQLKPIGEGEGRRIVVAAACGSDFNYDRIYIEAGHVMALTLQLASDFDTGKI